MYQQRKSSMFIALCGLFLSAAACSDPWITVNLDGAWPERLHVSVTYEDGAKEAGAPFDVNAQDGKFSFHIPRDDGRIRLTISSLMDHDGNKNCRFQHYSDEVETRGSKFGKDITIQYSIKPVLPLRCDCDAGWCQAKDALLADNGWNAVIGSGNKIWIIGDNNKSAYWNGGTWNTGRVNDNTMATSNQYALWFHGSKLIAAGDSTTARWNETNTAWEAAIPEYEFRYISGISEPYPFKAHRSIWSDQSENIWFGGGTVSGGYMVSRQNSTACQTGCAEKTGQTTINSLWASSVAEIWAVGDGGIISVRKNSQWQEPSNIKADAIKGSTSVLNSIWGTNASNIWIAGASATLLHWQGSLWNKEAISTEQDLSTIHFYSVWGSDSNDVWVIGTAGTILHFDGNNAWTKMPTTSAAAGHALRGIWGSDRNNIWIVGDGGTVLLRDP